MSPSFVMARFRVRVRASVRVGIRDWVQGLGFRV